MRHSEELQFLVVMRAKAGIRGSRAAAVASWPPACVGVTVFRRETFADGRSAHPLMERYWRRAVTETGRAERDLFEPSASYFDQAEPALAILGPPAVTRLMVELWRADPMIRSPHPLMLPSERRAA